jgi:hypothetical protein
MHSVGILYSIFARHPATDPQSRRVMDQWRQRLLTQCSAYLSARPMAGLSLLTPAQGLGKQVLGFNMHARHHAVFNAHESEVDK